LLWASLALLTIQVAASQALRSETIGDWASWIWLIAVTAVNGGLILLTSRRKNWARGIVTILGGVSIAAQVVGVLYFPQEFTKEPWWSNVLFIASDVVEIGAIIWLFSRPSNEWFKGVGGVGAF
jgi:hypothetical protein